MRSFGTFDEFVKVITGIVLPELNVGSYPEIAGSELINIEYVVEGSMSDVN